MVQYKISIITVVYNGAKTIEQTILSVLSQKYTNYEYIIIDGGSTDQTIEIINKYRDKITHFVSEPDDGIYDAMNKGIALATGDVIGIINSDDWYEPGVFECVNDAFADEEVDVVYGRQYAVVEDGRIEEQPKYPLENICFEMSVPHPSVFIRKKIYEKYGTFNKNYKIAADFDLILRLYLKGVKFKEINQFFTNFRKTGISNTQEALCITETRKTYDKYLSLDVMKESWDKLGGLAERVLVYGAGYWGEWVVDKFVKMGITDIVWVDSDDKKHGKEIRNIVIESPEALKDFDGSIMIAIFDENTLGEQIRTVANRSKAIVHIKQLIHNYNKCMSEFLTKN